MRLGFSSGYDENYWGDWFNGKSLGGSERIMVEVACALAAEGHEVTARLPYVTDPFRHRNVYWVGRDHPQLHFDLLYCFDQFGERDRALRTALVACRSDEPPHKNFDVRIYLSRHHARLMGDEGSPAIGGGVELSAYKEKLRRIPRRVICTVSPDRAPAAGRIGKAFDFVHTYKKVPGYDTTEVSREELVRHQLQAQAFIYPYDPIRESDFFSMAILEAMAAGTPCVIADGESHLELWSEAAIVIPRPVDLGTWYAQVSELLENPVLWRKHSSLGRSLAAKYDWKQVAARYLETSLA